MEGPTSKKTNESQRKHQVPEPPLVIRSISNKGPLERMPSLDEPSLITITCLKIEIDCAHCNATNILYL